MQNAFQMPSEHFVNALSAERVNFTINTDTFFFHFPTLINHEKNLKYKN